MTALGLLLACAALGLDPLVGVFGSMAGVATVGMVTLVLTTSIAVIAFFVRHPTTCAAGRGRPASHQSWLPSAGGPVGRRGGQGTTPTANVSGRGATQ